MKQNIDKPISDKRSNQQGFTLIEVMVVMIIIGLLAGIVGPNVLGALGKANTKKIEADFANISTALKLYKLDHYKYPDSDEGLGALTSDSGSGTGYMDAVPDDPWGNPYIYVSPGENGPFDLYTLGSDGVSGGEGEAADIGNW